jgi:thiol-disulfide isomerase/thioredoxin
LVKPVCLLVIFSAVVWAQRCDPPPPTAQLLRTLPDGNSERHKALAEILKSHPEDFWLNRSFLDGAVYEHAAIREKYRACFEANRSLENEYLYGRSLVGFDTKQALRIYSDILQKDPDNPWVHYSQLEIYRSDAFRDRAKLFISFDAVTRACPSWAEPYQYLTLLDDGALAPRAARLRTLLEASKDPRELRLYSALWSAEFRLKAEEEKSRVAADLKRLWEIEGTRATIAAGAKLIGDDALAKEMTPPRPFDIFEAEREWRQSHPALKPGDPPEKKRALAQSKLAASETWISNAPNRIGGYSDRLDALKMLNAPPEEIGKAAEDVVRIARTDDHADSGPTIELVAALYLDRGIYLDRVPVLIKEALSLVDDPEGFIEIDLAPNHEMVAQGRIRLSYWHISALVTLSKYYEKLNQMDKARSVLSSVPGFLAQLSIPEGTHDAGLGHNLLLFHAEANYAYWNRIAELDEREQKPEEALRDYREALLNWDGPREKLLVKQRQLWKDLGRSDEAWQAWVDSIPLPPRKGQGQSPAEFAAVRRTLPKVTLKDLDGNEWPPDRLAKTTVAVVWATWCVPCRNELPFFEKLAERMKNRTDVQVISLTVDENPETAKQFVQKNGYSFPVLSAKNFAEDAMPYFSIPRTWIIRNGVIAQEAEGFGGDGDHWVDRVAAQVN